MTWRAWIALAAVAAVSCAAPLLKLPSASGVAAGDGAAAIAQALTACRGVSTLTAQVAVSGKVNGQRIRARLQVGLAQPASAYIEAPAPFGAPIFVLAAQNDDATLLLPRDRRVLEHGRPADVLEAIAGVPLSPGALRTTLTGCVADNDTRTAAPSLTQGSSLQASNILVEPAMRSRTVRFAPPRIELVATRPASVAALDSSCTRAFSNQYVTRSAPPETRPS